MKRWLLLLALLVLPGIAAAQSTTVSGTVSDTPDAQTWNNGTVTISFTPNPNYPSISSYTWSGGALSQTVSTILSATGTYSVSVPSSSAISPQGSTWSFSFCPQATAVCFPLNSVTVTGATQTLNAAPPSIRVNLLAVSPPVSLYATGEAVGAKIGSQFTLLGISPSLQVCTAVSGNSCTTWSAAGGSPSGLTTFFNRYYGLAPDDCGNVGCTTPVTPAIRYVKFCYDGVVTGQPTTTFKSLATATITNTALTSNVATYTISAAQPLASGELVTVTGTSNGGGVFNVTNQPILNYVSGATTFTVAITNANVGSAADSGTATASCANFQAADATSTIEILTGGLNTALDVSTTISAVVSASQVTLGANATTNATGKKFWFGTDATTPLQNWVNAINLGIPTATGLQTHSGYVPGLYLATKPLRFINPLGAFNGQQCTGTTGAGYGTTEPFSAQNANESLSIWGQGAYRSGFVAGSQFNWAAAGTAVDTGVFHFACWNGPTIQNIAILSGDYGIAFNTSTLTAKFGAFFDDANGHVIINGMEIENFHNTTSSLVADQLDNGFFEENRNGVQIYNSDCAGVYGALSGSASFRGLTLNNYVWGGTRGSGCNPGAAVVFGGGSSGIANSLHVSNFILDSEAGSADMPAGLGLINFAQNFGPLDDNDEVQFENGRIQTLTQNNFALSVNASAGKNKISWTNVNLVNTNPAANANTQLVLIQNGTSDWNFFGGSLGVTGTAANGISVASGSVLHTHGTRQFGTIGIVGTGASSVSLMTPAATGWTGQGSWQASTYQTTTNCQLGGAAGTTSPAACGSAAAGMIAVPASQTTYTVNTTQVTANSEIRVQQMTDNSGLPSSPTCNAGSTTPIVASRVAGTSFTINLTSVASVTCFNYSIVN